MSCIRRFHCNYKHTEKSCYYFELEKQHKPDAFFHSYTLRNFIEIPLRHGCSPVNLLHIFTTPFPKSTSGRLLEIANNNEFTYQDAKDLLEMTYTRTNYKRTLESKFRSLLFRKCTKINQFCSELYSYQRTL